MSRYTVRTPEPGVYDKIGGVQFVDGVAQVDEDLHAAELRYFRAAGYTVEEPAPAADEEPKTSRGRRAASTNEEAAK